MPTLLWWGRADAAYSRNSLIIGLLHDLGWQVEMFHPVSSRTGVVEAFLHRLRKPDLVWVPCFRHRDIASAAFWARRWSVPLLVDPLISAYEKEVFEKRKYPVQSRAAARLRQWESGLLAKADLVLADTPAHAAFFCKELAARPEKVKVLYVGAETRLFKGESAPLPGPPFEILFYGSFLQLQGIDVIVKAAALLDDARLRWVLLGDGALRRDIETLAAGAENISFEPWIDYARLPARLARAHILLGVFGTTPKAEMVIPNKVFQAMAAARPLITRRAKAYPVELAESAVIGWVEAGDPAALAALVQKWLAEPEKLVRRGLDTRQLFEEYFSEERLRQDLEELLQVALGAKKAGTLSGEREFA